MFSFVPGDIMKFKEPIRFVQQTATTLEAAEEPDVYLGSRPDVGLGSGPDVGLGSGPDVGLGSGRVENCVRKR